MTQPISAAVACNELRPRAARSRVLRRLAPCASLLALLLGTQSASATEWYRGPSDVRWSGGPRDVAQAYLRDGRELLRLEGVALVPHGESGVGAWRTVRFEQHYQGLPVLQTAAAVRVNQDGRVHAATLGVARGLDVPTEPLVSEAEARGIVAAWAGLAREPRTARLAVSPDPAPQGRLVWVVDRLGRRGGWRTLVDALDGVVLRELPLGMSVKGRVYETSRVQTPEPIDVDLPLLDIADPQHLNGWSGQLAVTNYVSGSEMDMEYVVEQELLPNSGEDFLYDPPEDRLDDADGFAQVNLYYHLTRGRAHFVDSFGVDMSGASWGLVAVANMQEDGEPLDNAFFTAMGAEPPFDAPNMIAVGQGSMFDFAEDSDVFLHEFTHFVNYRAIGFNEGIFETSEWGIVTGGSAIDEGTADYHACTLNGDPVLGEGSLELLGDPRDLTDTHKTCPEDVTGEGHQDGEIISSLSWTLREELGFVATDQLVWGAVSLLTNGSALGDYAQGLVTAANAMVDEGTLSSADVTFIENAIAARHLDDCGHELAVSPGTPRVTLMFGLGVLAEYMETTCEAMAAFGVRLQSLFHFRATPQPTDTSVRFAVELELDGEGMVDWAIYVRRNEHVSFRTTGMLPEVNEFDYAAEGLTGASGELVIDATSNPPFDPNATYHMVVTHANCPNARATITVGEPGAGGAGGSGGAGGAGNEGGSSPEVAGEGSGCDCRAGSSEGPRGGGAGALGLGLALGGLAWARRRRAGR